MTELLPIGDLPNGFTYPAEYIRTVELGLRNFEPWWIIDGRFLRDRFVGLKERYPELSLVPFAFREDNDDVACWDTVSRNVVIIHDFASPGYERRAELVDFHAWLRLAVDDFIEFE